MGKSTNLWCVIEIGFFFILHSVYGFITNLEWVFQDIQFNYEVVKYIFEFFFSDENGKFHALNV